MAFRKIVICVSLLTLSFLLASCSGGGGDSSPSTDDTILKSGDLRYTGVSTPAVLEPATVGQFFNILFSKLVASRDPMEGVPIEFGSCQSGSLTVKEKLDANSLGIVEFIANNCLSGSIYYSGKYFLDIHENQSDGNLSYTLSYIDTHMVGNELDVIVNGKILVDERNTNPPESTVVNIVIWDQITDVKYKLDLEYNVTHEEEFNFTPIEQISGVIYDSRFGHINISTLEPLRYENWNYDLYPNVAGKITFSGINNSVATLWIEDRSFINVGSSQYLDELIEYKVAHLNIDNEGDSIYDHFAVSPIDPYNMGSLWDIGDDDNDGMPNSWETVFNLNHADSSDATIDTDNDGYSNVEEYKSFSDPVDPNIISRSVDLTPSLFIQSELLVTDGNIPVFYSVERANGNRSEGRGATDIIVRIAKRGSIEWGSRFPDGCSIDTENKDILVCAPDDLRILYASGRFTIYATEPTSFSLTATVSSSTNDPDLANNSNSLESEIVQHSVRFRVDPLEYSDIAGLGVIHSYDVRIYNESLIDLQNVEFEIVAPNIVTFSKAGYLDVDSGVGGDCSVSENATNTTVACNIDLASASGDVLVTVDVVGNEIGTADVTYSVISDFAKIAPYFNPVTVSSLNVKSSTIDIQAQIDLAQPGNVISIPDGEYVGGLNLSDLPITVQGQGLNTIIYPTLPSLNAPSNITVGTGSVLRGITFKGFGKAIDIVGTGSVLENNTFTEYIVPNGEVLIDAGNTSTTIRANKFINVACETLISLEESSFIVENNIFSGHPVWGTNCVTIESRVALRASREGPLSRYIINNTFVKQNIGIILNPIGDDEIYLVENNIFYNNRSWAIRNTVIPNGPLNPIIDSNLVFGSSSYQNIGGANTVSADPLFTDIANYDYRLLPDSPAIDSGKLLNAPANDINGNVRPIDGDNDTIFLPDLGAYEFLP